MLKGEHVNTVVVGCGQAGISMSENLSRFRVPHVVLEEETVAHRWQDWRWDSLVANGPAWSNCLPSLVDNAFAPDAFQPKEAVHSYLVRYSRAVNVPVQEHVRVENVRRRGAGAGFVVETSLGELTSDRVICATGAYHKPYIPSHEHVPDGISEMHSVDYKNPSQVPSGGVLVVGAGSSGAQIADELKEAGRDVYLSVSKHHRCPRRYRGRDYNWWLGVLGDWDRQIPDHRDHYTVAVTGSKGGYTIDYREFAARGIKLTGRVRELDDGTIYFDEDLEENLAFGDESYLAFLRRIDEYVSRHGLDLPEDNAAWGLGNIEFSKSRASRILELNRHSIGTIIWATGFTMDYGWLKVEGALDERGRPSHYRGRSSADGVYFVGLPFLTCFGSSFLISVWYDAEVVARTIAREMRFEDGERFFNVAL